MPTPDEVPTLDLRGEAAAHRVGWGFISLYALAFISTSLVFLAPLLVSLALKINSLVGIEQAPNSLSVVTGIGALLAMVGNPFFGRMSDRTSSRLGMRRPWMVIGLVGGSLGILVVALAPSVPVVLVGWWRQQPPRRGASSRRPQPAVAPPRPLTPGVALDAPAHPGITTLLITRGDYRSPRRLLPCGHPKVRRQGKGAR